MNKKYSSNEHKNSSNEQKIVQMDKKYSSNGHKNSSNGQKIQMDIKIVQWT